MANGMPDTSGRRVLRILHYLAQRQKPVLASAIARDCAFPRSSTYRLLHVMAEPPAIYADLVRLEEDVDQLLESKSELGTNLSHQRKELERIGVAAEVRVRHGIVLDQVFAEAREGDYDLIVTGTSRARGLVRHYIMGDLTREVVNRANVPVLVARSGKNGGEPPAGIWSTFKQLVAASWGKA